MLLFVGLDGVTCGGKSSAANMLKERLLSENIPCAVAEQDLYYRPVENLRFISHLNNWNWDEPDAIDFKQFLEKIEFLADEMKREQNSVIIIEGNLIYSEQKIRDWCGLKYFWKLDHEECKLRRERRVYEPPDTPHFFDETVWPEYVKHKNFVEGNCPNVTYLNGQIELDTLVEQIFIDITRIILGLGKREGKDMYWLKYSSISAIDATKFVSDSCCGAISIFIGTTRNNSEGKEVIKLQYETYEDMAVSELSKLCKRLHAKWPEIARTCILHRLGDVPVTEASVIIAVSSPHRAAAQEATQFAIDELKTNVPIWKKEIYKDGASVWKQNSECKWYSP